MEGIPAKEYQDLIGLKLSSTYQKNDSIWKN